MPRLSQAEIRNNAISFVHDWKDETRERAESQTFWNEFLEIFGIKRRQVAVFERAVQKNNLNTGAIDLFWRGVLLVEHKSRGQNFDKASSQAFEYLENLPENELPEYVLISDFARFRLFNLETNEETTFNLEDLPSLIHLFGAISGYQKREYKEQDPVNLKVALKLGELHDALLDIGYAGQKLEVFLVRLVYCLFADDTGIFLPRSSFQFLLDEKTAEDGSNLGAMLSQFFQVLDTPEAARQTTLDEDLKAFPHVNGALFKDRFDLPFFNRQMRRLVLETCSFDWSKVSPAIFGSLFQSVMDTEKRRNLGAHYTSEKNILKVIHGLFLDDLLTEFESVKNNLNKLRTFHEKLATLRFFDPACGSGNFLVITYREMRRLELAVIKQTHLLSGGERAAFQFKTEELSRIDVDSFYGIEYEEFPTEIARVALWLTDHIANMELSAAFGVAYDRLPLKQSPNIVHGNALRLDWAEVLGLMTVNRPGSGGSAALFAEKLGFSEGASLDASGSAAGGIAANDHDEESVKPSFTANRQAEPENQSLYILGNPPFIGKTYRSDEQNADMDIACSDVPSYRTLDYVCAWYIKAAKFLVGTPASLPASALSVAGRDAGVPIRVAFVSTNSITQGEQVGVLWPYLLQKRVKIHFAHRTFKWSNEASGKAAVFCVIIGFGFGDVKKKRLFDYENPKAEPQEIAVTNINPYLVDYADVVISNRTNAISEVPQISFGNQPIDGGFLILSTEEKVDLIRSFPGAASLVRKFVGSREFINGEERWCLWLRDAPPNALREIPEIHNRIQAVRDFRLASNRPDTRTLADSPTLFAFVSHRDVSYVLIPSVSSERRRFVPIGFMPADVIASNLCLIVPNATLYHFGVLTSTMHNAWMRQICGRLKSDYRYSNKLVYNNFPWPERRDEGGGMRDKVEKTAQGILDARLKFPGSTLADLYDPLTMPKELLDAHRANDEAVDACYGKRRFKNELERLEFLFDLYRKYTEPLVAAEKPKRRGRKTIK